MAYDGYDRYALFELEDLENLERIERRYRYIPQSRQNDINDLDEIDFRARYRLNKSTVEDLVVLLGENLRSQTELNMALTPSEKILIALRFFASGNQQINIGDLIRVSQPSVSRAIKEVARSLAELRPQYIYLPQDESERREICASFYRMCGFPGVYGALDCTHIELQSPGGNMAETFRCRKGFFSLNVQTLSDANLFIRNIVVRWPGSTHDSTIFDNSYLRAHLQTEVPSTYHVLGDNGYPLRSYLMTPFLNPTSDREKRYNTAHVLGRNVVECQYGVWKKRFSCVSIPLRCALPNAQTIIIATAVLHNIALTLGDTYDIDGIPEPEPNYNNLTRESVGIAKRNNIVNTFFN